MTFASNPFDRKVDFPMRSGTPRRIRFSVPVVLLVGAVVVLDCSGGPGLARAQEVTKPSPSRDADVKAITALLAEFSRAFDAGDSAAVAATFAADALVVDEEGERTEGRDAIREQYASFFAATPGGKIAVQTDSLRFLGPDTALEEGRTVITPADHGKPQLSRYTVVYMKIDGRWLQSAVRDENARELSAHDHLKELEWLVGEWVNESQDAVVHTTCKWTDDHNFLLRDFTVKTQGRSVLSGSQRIGWDPLRGQFKTWVFDSEGGFGEGYWSNDGNRWVVKVEGVRQDGKSASATTILTRLSKDRIEWRSVDRTLGGAAVAEEDEFVVVRKPPEVGK